MPKSEREATVLAISEACNNSIEHAYRKRSGTFKVVVEHRAETLEIRISDEGEWREPVQDSTRRKGLTLMTGLTRSARIEGGETGTEVVLEQRL